MCEEVGVMTESDDISGDAKSIDQNVVMLEIQSRLGAGGTLDVLLHKVDRIEEGQEDLRRQVKDGHADSNKRFDTLHDALYDPDAGLFARVKSTAVDAAKRISEVENKVASSVQASTTDIEKLKKVDAAMERIDEVIRTTSMVKRIAGWTIATLATGGAGLLGKLIYDWLVVHIKLV